MREFLGHTIYEFDQQYSLQSLKDNLALFTLDLLDEINQIVVRAGHDRVGGQGEFRLKGRCDSFVVETDVHYPTDINLLLDAIRKVGFLIGELCDQLGVTDWRTDRHFSKRSGSNLRGAPAQTFVIKEWCEKGSTGAVDYRGASAIRGFG